MTSRFVIDTIGATSPEFVSAALARHPHISVLPGLAFVRDDLRLYREHNLAGLDGRMVFDRLWAPSFEPSGRMWAGIPRHLSREQRRALDIESARTAFAREWSSDDSYLETLFKFARHATPLFGAWKPGSTHMGFCGAPFLRILDWDELAGSGVKVLSANVALPIWLALISHRSIVNCHDALRTWIVHALLVACARDHGVEVHPVDAVAAGVEGNLPTAFEVLGADPSLPLFPHAGSGHVEFDPKLFSYTESLAADLVALFAGDPLYETASRAATWSTEVVTDNRIRQLLQLYLRYWRSTAHIHFDSVGPLEQEIVHAALDQIGELKCVDTRTFQQRFSQAFFFNHIRFRSYTFESPQVDLDSYLGDIEDLIKLPRAPYFVHASLCYLEEVLAKQEKWVDSFLPLARSSVYRRLCDPSLRRLIDTNDFRFRLEALEERDRKAYAIAADRAADREAKEDNGATSS